MNPNKDMFPPEHTFWWKLKYYLHCTPIIHCECENDPMWNGESWVYTIQVRGKTNRLFGIKLNTIKYEY